VRAAAAGVLADIEQEIAELSGKRDRLRETLVDWDARLAQAPRGTAARLLESLPRPTIDVQGRFVGRGTT
jgi:hypothetical protein